jgi:hypothetical protein
LRDDASHRFELGEAFFLHRNDQSPLIGRLGGGRCDNGLSLGEGGGLGGRFSF